jgi:putative addiction module killer protein
MAMDAKPRFVFCYETRNGRVPFEEWLDGFGDESAIAAIIVARTERVENGNFGDVEPVGKGVFELKIDVGPGYRVYFGQSGDIVVLLTGGDKSTQNADINNARALWEEFSSRDEND